MSQPGVSRPAAPSAADAWWPAPTPARPVGATVALPGSKSQTNRALPLAALADSPTVIRRALRSRDTDLMTGALRALGEAVDDSGPDWTVMPAALRGPADIDCGLAGTVARFAVALASLATGTVSFDGDPRARQRPLRPLVDGLRQLGVTVEDDGRGALPLSIIGTGSVRGGDVVIDSSASSQFISALLLIAPKANDEIVLRHRGAALPSEPHIAMTVSMLRERGIAIDTTEYGTWRVAPGTIAGGIIDIEPDLSNAGPFLAAAMVTGGSIHIDGWPLHTTQPGDALRGLLSDMGATVAIDESGLTLQGAATIHGIDVDLRENSELSPTIAALACFADTPSTLRGIGHIRGHETDRLSALA
ncbi:MAG TPA: 3-phosphoshikimate 1-carboxyvinyltransferase, partial [Acidothermaceae bacterium]|nr:3-phosphoshikimate 1-carboxyvinyltransferase [Acidothermaceae bacterium]